jgi:hypothetical protein
MIAKHGNLYGSVQRRTGRRNAPAKVACESLEARNLLSSEGITASFDANTGALTVVGTEGDDVILIHPAQWAPELLTVPGLGVIDRSLVKSIVIDCKGGNDGVELSGQAPALNWYFDRHPDENQPLDASITIYGGDGDDEMYAQTTAGATYYGGAGRDQGGLYGDNDLFSTEVVHDCRTDGQGMFQWADGGNHLFANPFKYRIDGAWYYEPNFNDQGDGQNQGGGSQYADDQSGNSNHTIGPAPAPAPAAAGQPGVEPPAAVMPTFSTRPLRAAHVWDDQAPAAD